jgi:hypothetical protein
MVKKMKVPFALFVMQVYEVLDLVQIEDLEDLCVNPVCESLEFV